MPDRLPNTPLPELAEQARAAGRLAFDTEFITEGRYWPLLCLVQLSAELPDGSTSIAVVDALADEAPDPAPILPLLADPEIEVVVHAGEQDLALLRRVWGAEITQVFDTQVAAAFTGQRSQRSYQDLVKEFLGIALHKGESFTFWDRRPLTDEQLGYAREDVEHLPQLAHALHDRLAELGRLDWALDESLRASADPGERDPEEVFRKLGMSGRLPERATATARELVIWREQTARSDDRPLKSVLGDPALIQLARRRPHSLRELRNVRGVGEGSARRYGKQIVRVIEGAARKPPIKFKRPEKLPDEAEPLVALCQALVRARSLEEDVAAQMIGTRADFEQIVRAVLLAKGEPDTPLLTGWRRELVGEQLLELLGGKLSISVDPEVMRIGTAIGAPDASAGRD